MAVERAAFLTTWFDEIWNRGRLNAIEELFAEDGVMHGLGEAGGDHLGVPASGKRVSVTGMSMARLRDGKMVEGLNNWDMLSLMQQVDAIQPAAQLLP